MSPLVLNCQRDACFALAKSSNPADATETEGKHESVRGGGGDCSSCGVIVLAAVNSMLAKSPPDEFATYETGKSERGDVRWRDEQLRPKPDRVDRFIAAITGRSESASLEQQLVAEVKRNGKCSVGRCSSIRCRRMSKSPCSPNH